MKKNTIQVRFFAAKDELRISLERTGAGYFDFYLLHALGKNNVEKYDKYGLWDYVRSLKEEGIVKHWGFSFHDTADFLDELLTEHPEAQIIAGGSDDRDSFLDRFFYYCA